ncbi:MAG: S26 family signal peptidase [Desulfobacterales bacterium]
MFPDLITGLLQDGYKVSFSAPGHSMFPTIMANETILVEPIDPGRVRIGDIILYRTNGRLVAHRVVRIFKESICAITEAQTSKRLQPKLFIEGNNPPLKRSAPQVKRSSNEVLHFVLQGDASRACDEPVKAGQILGKVVAIERNACSVDPYCLQHKIECLVCFWGSRIKRLGRRILSIFFLFGR